MGNEESIFYQINGFPMMVNILKILENHLKTEFFIVELCENYVKNSFLQLFFNKIHFTQKGQAMERLISTRNRAERGEIIRKKMGEILHVLRNQNDNLSYIEAKTVLEEVVVYIEDTTRIAYPNIREI